VPLLVLLADDSVPAQNMGKKILVEAGYDVLTVSNGLEALRKIAEITPDIAILDIFMPGYTGLEICERLRANVATAALPVILTVGKLEPYRPEDGEHVHSNAIIVKPFAGTELISAVRSLIGTSTPAVAEEPLEQAVSSQEVDPLQDDFINVPGPDFSDPLSTGQLAAQPSETKPAETDDEPLFSYGSQADSANVAPAEAILPELDEPASLVFNPDAVPTPFSASVIDFLPSAPQQSPETEVSAFAEFDLGSELSTYVPVVEAASSLATEPSVFTPADAHSVEPAAEVTDSALAVMVVPEPEPEVIVAAQPDLEAEPLDVPTLDPLLELSETEAPVVAVSDQSNDLLEDFNSERPVLDDVVPESAVPDDTVLEDEPESTSFEVPLTPEEEARRQAFEALFNSDDPLPVEGYSPSLAGNEELLPNLAGPTAYSSSSIVADPELEPLFEADPQFVAPEPDASLAEDETQIHAIGTIPGRDPLLDDSLEASEWTGIENTSEPESLPVSETPLPVHEIEILGQALEAVPEAAVQEAVADDEPFFAIEAQPDPFGVLDSEEPLASEPQSEIPSSEAQPISEDVLSETPVVPEFAQSIVFSVVPDSVAEVLEPEINQPPVVAPEVPALESAPTETESLREEPAAAVEISDISETERIQQAIERVFDRIRPLLVEAIVREMSRRD